MKQATEPTRRTGNKRGENKGIAARRKADRRLDAEERNKRTPDERKRVTREGPVSKRARAR